jgi:hypothetical protein
MRFKALSRKLRRRFFYAADRIASGRAMRPQKLARAAGSPPTALRSV